MKKVPSCGPSQSDLDLAFQALLFKSAELTSEQWIIYSRFARFDARLAEAWIKALSQNWQSMSVFQLRDQNSEYAHPATLGLLIEQTLEFLIEKPEKSLFSHWKNIILEQVAAAENEFFLVGVLPFASESMRKQSETCPKIFQKWGFIGNEIFINKYREKQSKLQKTILSATVRRSILDSLCKNSERITAQSYLEACEYGISQRIAQIELSQHPKLIAKGNTRNRFYRVR